MTKQITNYEDTFDSRDVLERIEELESKLDEVLEDYPEEQESIDEIQEELDNLNSIRNQYYDQAEFEFGVTFIRDSYFEDYAREFAWDIGRISDLDSIEWPLNCIDWEEAANELQSDYTDIDFDGVTYWAR